MLTLTEETNLVAFERQIDAAIAEALAGDRPRADAPLVACQEALAAAASLVALLRSREHVKAVQRELGDDPDAAIEVMLRLADDVRKRESALDAVLAELEELEGAGHLPHLQVPLYLRAAQLSAEAAAFRELRFGPPADEGE